MKSKIFIWILCILIFSSLTLAYEPTAIADYNLYDSGDIALDGSNPVSGTNLGTTGWTVNSGDFTYNTAGAAELETLSIWTSSAGYVEKGLSTTSNITIQVSMYDDTSYVGGYNPVIKSDAIEFGIYAGESTTHFAYYDAGWATTTIARSTGWHNWTIYVSGTYIEFYVDGTLAHNTTNDGETSLAKLSGSTGETIFDEFKVWNGTPGQAPVPPVTADTINISETNPTENYIFNVNTINLNATGNFSNPSLTNCSLYINGTLNQTVNGYAAGSEEPISFNVTFPADEENIYGYFIGCIDNQSAINTSEVTFKIDQVAPTLLTDFVNASLVFNRNYTTWFNVSDSLALNSVNISIDGLTYIFNDTMTGTAYNKELTINALNLSSGEHNLSIRIADGHTATEIPEYIVKTPILFNNWIKYEFNDRLGYVQVKGLDASILDKFTTEKKLDRYEFTYEPWNDAETSYEFEVESDSYIKIVNRPDTKYKSWLIVDDKWMDFYTDDNPFDEVEITRLSDKKVSVKVSNVVLKDGKIKFKSIGDLNIIEQNFTFFTSNYSLSYTNPVLSLESQNVGFSVGDYTGLTTTASLYWNNTLKTSTKTTPAGFETFNSAFTTEDFNKNVNISAYWAYSVTDGTFTEAGNVSFVQEVLNIGIDDCSSYTTQGINYSIKNESDESLMLGDASAAFKIWLNSSSNYKAFNLSWTNVSTFGVCINPSSLNISYYTQLEYKADSQTKTYYINNANLDNVTDYINLYIEDDTTQVTFTVIDENDNAVENAFINVLSYDLGTDSFKTTEILETDSNGKAVGNIVLNTQFYKFLITLNDETVLSTSPTKITSTTQTFQVVLGEDYLETFTTANNVGCTMDYDNSTKGFSFTFNNPSGTEVAACLDLIKSSLNSDRVINSTCINSAAGTLNLYIPGAVQDYTYYAQGLITIDGNEFVCADDSVSFKDTYKKFGTSGLMGTFLLTIALIAIGLWSPIVAILLAVIGLVASWFLGFFFLTPGYMIAFVICAIIFMVRLNK